MPSPYNQPDYNTLPSSGFRVSIKRIPGVVYNVVSTSIPAVTSNPVVTPTPFTNLKNTPDRLIFEDFSMTYRVSENLSNYQEIFSWLEGITFPESFDQYAAEKRRNEMKSDIEVTILNSKQSPVARCTLINAFPISLSGLSFTTEVDGITYVENTAVFSYDYFKISSI